MPKFGNIIMMAESHLAVGNLMQFYRLMDAYMKEQILLIDIPDGLSRQDAFFLGYDWYNALEEAVPKTIQLFEKLNTFSVKPSFPGNAVEAMDLKLMSKRFYEYAEKYLGGDDLVDIEIGCCMMEGLEVLQNPVSKKVYEMKRRLLNVINSTMPENGATSLMNRGMELLKINMNNATECYYDE